VPPRSVLLTFDDAYRDFEEHAWPVLKHYEIPVTLFVPTAYPDQPGQTFWWDRLHQVIRHGASRKSVDTPLGPLSLESTRDRDQSFERLKNCIKSLPHTEAMAWVHHVTAQVGSPSPLHHVLGWHDLRRLAGEGVTLGAHTRTHPLLNRLAPAEAAAEAVGAWRDLEQQIGSALPIFAYPGGEFNDSVVRALDDAGFELAFTTVRGINDLDRADRLRLRRINIGARTTQPLLRAQLLPWSAHLQRWT
jgi:peptidoglycan/xylan/chitin deacetylase (PgdA/CDA1 family)